MFVEFSSAFYDKDNIKKLEITNIEIQYKSNYFMFMFETSNTTSQLTIMLECLSQDQSDPSSDSTSG